LTHAVTETHTAGGDLAGWLRLTEAAGVGPATARVLLHHFGLPEQIFAASAAELGRLVAAPIVHALLSPPEARLRSLIERTMEWADRPGHRVLSLADSLYPAALLHISDPPTLLYVIGRADLLNAPQIAIVGSRRASPQGLLDARRFAASLSQSGLCITSGLALGIDTAAHEGALEGAGSTIAVTGTGADRVYPASNRALAHRIREAGTLVSEFPLGTPPLAPNFPRRNRLIAGLARGVLVVEAAAQSGSLITARLAAEQGRDVFAIPGSIHAGLTSGCHRLIRDGAALVESPEDVLQELGFSTVAAPPRPADLTTDPLLALLDQRPLPFDDLAERSGLDAARLSGRLLELELAQRITRLAGDRYQRLC